SRVSGPDPGHVSVQRRTVGTRTHRVSVGIETSAAFPRRSEKSISRLPVVDGEPGHCTLPWDLPPAAAPGRGAGLTVALARRHSRPESDQSPPSGVRSDYIAYSRYDHRWLPRWPIGAPKVLSDYRGLTQSSSYALFW